MIRREEGIRKEGRKAARVSGGSKKKAGSEEGRKGVKAEGLREGREGEGGGRGHRVTCPGVTCPEEGLHVRPC